MGRKSENQECVLSVSPTALRHSDRAWGGGRQGLRFWGDSVTQPWLLSSRCVREQPLREVVWGILAHPTLACSQHATLALPDPSLTQHPPYLSSQGGTPSPSLLFPATSPASRGAQWPSSPGSWPSRGTTGAGGWHCPCQETAGIVVPIINETAH